MAELIQVLFVRSEAPTPPPEGATPVTPERLIRTLNTLALAMAKEALLSPEGRAAKAGEIAAFVKTHLAVLDQAVRQ